MEPEPMVTARFETYGRPVDILRGGHVMVKVRYRDEAWQLLETLIKAFPGLPERKEKAPDWFQEVVDKMDQGILKTAGPGLLSPEFQQGLDQMRDDIDRSFRDGVDYVGFTPPFRDQVIQEAVRRRIRVVEDFCREAEKRGDGWRVAVSDMERPDLSSGRGALDYFVQLLQPGASPPPGKRWTVYGPFNGGRKESGGGGGSGRFVPSTEPYDVWVDPVTGKTIKWTYKGKRFRVENPDPGHTQYFYGPEGNWEWIEPYKARDITTGEERDFP